ncbi:MAG: inositol phosphorylceramide synthase [Thermoleophilia bacterium]|nr:inositol phosphorylceramide synthase [Thermoleophilia bacterium]
MTAHASSVPRRLPPRGWGDLAFQVSLWIGFLLAYQVARGIADRNPAKAFENGLKVIDIERNANALFELSLQRVLHSSDVLMAMASWTYWGSQFTVLGLTLLWVYLRRNEAFYRFRNCIMLANCIGLLGYVLLPTAPPRMFPDFGFADSLAGFGGLTHGSAVIELASNPYAAIPSLHAADSLILGVVMASVIRNRLLKAVWLAWPIWVWIVVMATGNHFWLDIVAGVAVALVAAAIIYRQPVRRRLAALHA